MRRPNPPLELWFAFLASLAAMLWFARHGTRAGLITAAVAFAAVAAWAAYRIASASLQPAHRSASHRTSLALAEISRITAVVYAWGGTALISLYRFTPLHWQHGWQYGSAMLLISAGLIAYIFLLDRKPASATSIGRVIALAALQGGAALAALVWLILSGKLATPKGDWAANAVFVSGGLAIAWISFLAVRTNRELKQIPA